MNGFLHRLRHMRGFPLLCAAGILGLLLLLPSQDNTGNGTSRNDAALPEEISVMCAYEDVVAHKIAQMTNTLLGCDGARVLITLETVPRSVSGSYFRQKNAADTYEIPTIAGIAVVCRGGGTAAVQLRVTEMLTAVFDVPAGRVFVGENQNTAVPN